MLSVVAAEEAPGPVAKPVFSPAKIHEPVCIFRNDTVRVASINRVLGGIRRGIEDVAKGVPLIPRSSPPFLLRDEEHVS